MLASSDPPGSIRGSLSGCSFVGERRLKQRSWQQRSAKIRIPADIHYLTNKMREARRRDSGRPPEFEGACIDIGAPRSLIGLKQPKAYCRAQGILLRTTHSRNTYSFGPYLTPSIGKMRILLPTKDSNIRVQVDVVPEDILFLVGLDIMAFYGLQPLAVGRKLHSVRGDSKIRLVKKRDHLILYWLPQSMK